MTRFAEGTTVSPDKSRLEIEAMVRKYGAGKFASGYDDKQGYVIFEANARRVRFVLPLPSAKDPKFTQDPRSRYRARSAAQAKAAYEQEVRRLWRALTLVIKAKLEVVQSGISTFETEFLAQVVMPTGETVGDYMGPRLDAMYGGGQMPPLLGQGGQ